MKKSLLLTLLLLAFTITSFADHGPRIQFIHNSADDLLEKVDIYMGYANQNLAEYLLVENFEYKQATEFTTFGLIYGPLTFYVLPAGVTDMAEALFIKTFGPPQIDYEQTFVIVASGNLDDDFDLILTEGTEVGSFNRTNVKVFHGSTDAPTVNIVETAIPAGLLIENLAYGESQGYLNLLSRNYILQLQTTSGDAIADFSLPLTFFEDQALYVTATGYADTTGPTPNKPLKLLAVETDGTVTELNAIQDNTPPRLQIIHNSASPAAALVDVWISDLNGSTKLLEDFRYKDATAYIDAPDLFTVSITATGSTDTSNAVLHKDFILNPGNTYAVMAAGDPGVNFDLFAMVGSETVSTAGTTDVKVFHGSTDAPMVDIDEVSFPAGIIVDDISFGESQAYLNLASVDYKLQVKTQEGIGAAEFSVPLSAFSDNVLIIAASGYLSSEAISSGNPFKLLAITPTGTVVEIDPNENLTPARIQIIHNSAVPAADFVDVYMDDQKIIDDFGFRTATSFIEVPGATEFKVDIDTKASIDNSFPIYSESFVLASGRSYIVVASGVVVLGSENYFPMRDFELIPILDAREESANPENVDLMVFHGSTDAPMVDINELTLPVNELVNDIDYGTTQSYLELMPGAYGLEIALASSGASVKKYSADLTSLEGQAITVLASGFLDPIKNNNGAEFGLYVALAEGGDLIELPSYEMATTARVQVIHNSADLAAATVDVWLNDALLLDNFEFRTASPFVDAPAGEEFTVSIAGPESESADDAIWSQNYTLAAGETYVLIANGIVSPSGYSPATPFDIYVYGMGRESASEATNTDILVFHGSTDAPSVDVVETGAGAGTIIDDLSYGSYTEYLELPTNDYQLTIKDETSSSIVAVYEAPLASLGLEGAALVTIASGFLSPSDNSNGAGFGLWAALPSGGQMVELSNITSLEENIIDDASMTIYPNPTSDIINFRFNLIKESEVNINVYDMNGRLVKSSSYDNTLKKNKNLSLNIEELNSGLYFVSIQAGKSIINRKIQLFN